MATKTNVVMMPVRERTKKLADSVQARAQAESERDAAEAALLQALLDELRPLMPAISGGVVVGDGTRLQGVSLGEMPGPGRRNALVWIVIDPDGTPRYCASPTIVIAPAEDAICEPIQITGEWPRGTTELIFKRVQEALDRHLTGARDEGTAKIREAARRFAAVTTLLRGAR